MILYFLVFVGGTLTKLLLRAHWLVLGTEYRTNGLFRTKFGTILSPGCRWFLPFNSGVSSVYIANYIARVRFNLISN